MNARPHKIISGGQTGADQGALLGARIIRVPTGGWMPRGFRTEDGPRPDLAELYALKEHHSSRYSARTEQNVIDSDGTLWVGRVGTPGHRATLGACERHNRAFIANPTPDELRAWLRQLNDYPHLNVAGNRESVTPGIFIRTADLIVETWGTRTQQGR